METEVKALENLVRTFTELQNEGVIISEEQYIRAKSLIKELEINIEDFLVNNPATQIQHNLIMTTRNIED